MNIFFKISLIAIVFVLLSVLLKSNKPEFVFLMRIFTVVMIFSLLLDDISVFVSNIMSTFLAFNVESEHINLLLKVVGITIVTDFVCDTLIDSGEKTLSGVISLSSKFLILYLALPIINGLVIFSLKLLE